MTITARELRNILAGLTFVDRDDIENAGYQISDKLWFSFQKQPHQTFLRMPDAAQEAITSIINKRARAS